LNVTGVSVDDPDGNIVENYSCKSETQLYQYCNAEVDPAAGRAIERARQGETQEIVWAIEAPVETRRADLLSRVGGNAGTLT
jgi:peptide/nickel transport system substrate-binding protein